MAIESLSSATAVLIQVRPPATADAVSPLRAEETSPVAQEARADPAASVAATEQILPPGGNPDRDAIDQAVSNMNTFIQNLQRDLLFEVDPELGHTVISVVDRSTNEVIRQIPSEEALARAQFLQEQIEATGGLLLKVQA